MNQIKICLVGVGRAGMVHALNFRQRIAEAQLVAIVDADLARARRQAKELGIKLFFDSIEAALTGADFDAVCIATPTHTHSFIAVAAARAGKHILCEKPMALTLEQSDAMIAAADIPPLMASGKFQGAMTAAIPFGS